MKQISLMELRHHLGAILDEIRITSEPVVLQRSGREIAVICPMDYLNRDTHGLTRRKEALDNLAGQGRAVARSKDLTEWLKKSRRTA